TDAGALEREQLVLLAGRVARHPRRLAEQHGELHVYRTVAEYPVVHREPAIAGGVPDEGERTPLALAQRTEAVEVAGGDGEHVAFLGLVAPDLQRRHAALFVRDEPQIDLPPALSRVHHFRDRIGQPPCADVVDREYGIVVALRPAAVDHFLGPALHLGIAALHGIEIERFLVGAAFQARCRPPAEPDQHSGPAQMYQQRTRRKLALERVPGVQAADAARDHDGLVVAARFSGDRLLERAEVAGDIGAPELVVERSAADRSFEHD